MSTVEVYLKLYNGVAFLANSYAIKREKKLVIEKEKNCLEKVGIIKKGLTGHSSTMPLIK